MSDSSWFSEHVSNPISHLMGESSLDGGAGDNLVSQGLGELTNGAGLGSIAGWHALGAHMSDTASDLLGFSEHRREDHDWGPLGDEIAAADQHAQTEQILTGAEKTPEMAAADRAQLAANQERSAEIARANSGNAEMKRSGQELRQRQWIANNPGAKAPDLSEF